MIDEMFFLHSTKKHVVLGRIESLETDSGCLDCVGDRDDCPGDDSVVIRVVRRLRTRRFVHGEMSVSLSRRV